MSYQHLSIPSPYLSVLNICLVFTRCHFLYHPGISSAHRPHHLVISPAFSRVFLCWGGTLLPASANRHLRHPASLLFPSMSARVSTAAVSVFLFLCRRHNYCPTYLLESSSSEISSTSLVYYPHYPASPPPPLSSSWASTELLITSSSGVPCPIVWICLLQSSPLFLLYTAWSNLLLSLWYALLNLIHSYCSSSILSTPIWLLYSVSHYFPPFSFTLIHYHTIFSLPSSLSFPSPIYSILITPLILLSAYPALYV